MHSKFIYLNIDTSCCFFLCHVSRPIKSFFITWFSSSIDVRVSIKLKCLEHGWMNLDYHFIAWYANLWSSIRAMRLAIESITHYVPNIEFIMYHELHMILTKWHIRYIMHNIHVNIHILQRIQALRIKWYLCNMDYYHPS